MRTTLLPPLAIVTAMMLFAVGDNFVAEVSGDMSVWQFQASRSVLILPFMLIVMALVGQFASIRVKRPWAVAGRCFFSISALMLYFGAVPAVSVPLAAAGLFTSPIFVVIFSALFFGERVGIRRLIAMAIGFVGVCLVLEIATVPLQPMMLMPMLGGALYALSVIWTRRYCQQESAGALAVWSMTTFLIYGAVGMTLTPWIGAALDGIEGTAFLSHPPAWPEPYALWVILGIGAGAGTGMVLLAWGYRSVEATYAALFDYSFLVWGSLFAWLIHG
ncbi:MAG: DMT family transporter, partial [Pseudomonadota bacterium]